ncbi:formate dehydrogenase family accessory protein FdhD [Oceanobacillus zhaokaii]|uniref:Sulfur carrier protein FdhD n=1 Tax=Oceanobacillus zhaokaii TaxID=2052660 RepID=A0A345PDQ6_9BACI|nr:formate dehydrogenase accessory sulfurtransferase FdhD [Oceanobacillus zhaokaii]AXI08136.1 formate dehydrogenase family accessory protein FdhD [Oceanobacillus zhaokaii]
MNDVKENSWEIIRFDGDSKSVLKEDVAIEKPFTIVLNGEEFATIVCTPTDLQDLIIGFLAAEGVIRFYDEIKSISIDEKLGFSYVQLNKDLDVIQLDHSKRFIGSCCGKSRQFYFKSDVRTAKTITSKLTISVNQCFTLMKELQTKSEQFIKTGGVHNAALATQNELIMIRSDIGRHNALDKLYGHVIQNRIGLSDKLVVFSGRISSEVLLKISKMGVGILISKSAPTDLALQLADDLGITAIGFARGNRLNIYTHPYRISEASNHP